MASIVQPIFSPFRRSYRYIQRQAHENPVILWSLVIGGLGPVLLAVVPPVRKSMGWKPTERLPTTYPLPNRQRRSVSGYDDE